MGIYSRHMEPEYNVQANESYVGTLGCYNALIDMERNNRAIFEYNIARDFQEATMINEGASEEEMIAFTEASLSGIIDAFKSMIKKIWEKIKGVFSTFIKKLDTVIIRDNKKFVEKYQRQVRTKNLSKLKYKYCKQLEGFEELKTALTTGTKLQTRAVELVQIAYNDTASKNMREKIDNGELEADILSRCVSEKLKNVEMKDLAKEIHEMCFDSEESEEGLDSARLTEIILILQGDKTKKEITDAQKTTDKHFKQVLKEIDNYSKELSKLKFEKDDNGNDKPISMKAPRKKSDRTFNSSEDVTNELKNIGTAQNSVSILENVHNRLVACFLNENKFRITQARKVFAKAVSYNDKAKNESTYLDAVEEAAEYEINEMFEQYCL